MNQSILFRQYDWGSDEYGQALILRNRLLRRPLGLCLYDEELGLEKAFLHFGAFQNGQLIATLLLVPESNGLYRMKQVATAEAFQKKASVWSWCSFAKKLCGAKGLRALSSMREKRRRAFMKRPAIHRWANRFWKWASPIRPWKNGGNYLPS